jgi:hypothetical protein
VAGERSPHARGDGPISLKLLGRIVVDMTWRDVLIAGAFDPVIGRVREALEAYLTEYPEDEEDLNRAVQANLEKYGDGFVYPTLHYIREEYEPDMEGDELYGLFLNALPLHVDFGHWDFEEWE